MGCAGREGGSSRVPCAVLASEKPLAAGPLVVPGALQVSKANTLEKLPAPRNAHGAQ